MKKTAPQEQGAGWVSLKELWENRNITPAMIAKWMCVEESIVVAWGDGTQVPNACQCIWLSIILDCKVKDIYLAIIRS